MGLEKVVKSPKNFSLKSWQPCISDWSLVSVHFLKMFRAICLLILHFVVLIPVLFATLVNSSYFTFGSNIVTVSDIM